MLILEFEDEQMGGDRGYLCLSVRPGFADGISGAEMCFDKRCVVGVLKRAIVTAAEPHRVRSLWRSSRRVSVDTAASNHI